MASLNTRASLAQFVQTQALAPRFGNNIEILPLEQAASDAIVAAVNRFAKLLSAEPLMNDFVDAIHLCQSNLGSLRFYHSMNQQSRASHPTYGQTPFTTPERLAELARWGQAFQQRVEQLKSPEGKTVMRLLMQSYGHLIALTRQYPDQHGYDDFQTGLERCLEVMKQLP